MTRSVSNNECALRRREIAIRHVNGDALFAFGTQTISQQSQVQRSVAITGARFFNGRQLILKNSFSVVQQTANQRRFAVVNRACGSDTQNHQKYPSRLRSSMAESEKLSSARVAPRSVIRAAATSTRTSSTLLAVERTAPVQLASPTVR
ncbi:unannotated protein [freshwater metagenome]|uniref:Unannotated protein n=1 Tax=freshwater metagenome TaxID=449393 RepID=A0A6J6CR70_9ZZZZ